MPPLPSLTGLAVEPEAAESAAARDRVLLSALIAGAVLLLCVAAGTAAVLRTLGAHPETGDPVEVLDGRYGPYVRHGKVNASLPKDQSPEEIDLQAALALLAARPAGRKRGGARA